jgi:glutamine synthetase
MDRAIEPHTPFAFTGNPLRVRAAGVSMSIAGSQVALNTMMSESLDYIATELEKATGGKKSKLNTAVQELLQKLMIEHEAVIFNGDGYSEEWHKEAERRGLANLKATPDALPMLSAPATIDLFTKYGVLTEAELRSRQEIYLEMYCKTIETEANLMLRMAKTVIFPASFRYQNELAQACANMKAIGKEFGTTTLDQLTANLRGMQKVTYELEALLEADKGASTLDHAMYFQKTILPAMGEVRKHADLLETLVADDLWTLPSYMEMLFIR